MADSESFEVKSYSTIETQKITTNKSTYKISTKWGPENNNQLEFSITSGVWINGEKQRGQARILGLRCVAKFKDNETFPDTIEYSLKSKGINYTPTTKSYAQKAIGITGRNQDQGLRVYLASIGINNKFPRHRGSKGIKAIEMNPAFPLHRGPKGINITAFENFIYDLITPDS